MNFPLFPKLWLTEMIDMPESLGLSLLNQYLTICRTKFCFDFLVKTKTVKDKE